MKLSKFIGKKIVLIILLGFILTLLNGCADVSSHVTINSDGSADLDFTLMIDNGLTATSYAQSAFSKIESAAGQDGASVRTIKNGNSEGIEVTRHFNTLQDLLDSNMMKLAVQSKDAVQVEKKYNLLTTNYTIRMTVDPAKSLGEGGRVTSLISEQMNYSFELSVPQKAESSNADQVSSNGRDYSWRLTPGENNEISLQMKVVNLHNVIMLGLGCIVFLCLLALAVLLLLTRRRKEQS